MIKIEDIRFSSSSIDDAFAKPTRTANDGRLRVATAADLQGFVRVAADKLVRISQNDFWKLGSDEEGFFVERLVDDGEGPVKD